VICRGQEDEAREALQQTLLRVLRYAKPFDSEEVFWSWLTMLARSSARDGGRKLQRYRRMLNRFASWWQSDADRQQSAGYESNTLHSLLDETLNELLPEDKALIMDKYFSGHSVRELAASNGATEKSIEGRLVRLRRVLRGRVVEKLRTL
jgi:RNA polymerase sigma factor (sigma-70 family)